MNRIMCVRANIMKKKIHVKTNIRKTTNLSTRSGDVENYRFGIFYSSSRLNCSDIKFFVRGIVCGRPKGR